MAGDEGLRERKRRRTRQHIADAATTLFTQRGFDAVRVTEIAEAAEVAEKTVYNHFASKAELVFDESDQLLTALLDAVRTRPTDEPAVTAVRRFTTRLAEWAAHRRPVRPTPEFLRMIADSPALQDHRRRMFAQWERALAYLLAAETGAEPGSVEPFVVAVALVAALRAPFEATRGGPEATHHDAAAALGLLETGLKGYAPAASGTDSVTPQRMEQP